MPQTMQQPVVDRRAFPQRLRALSLPRTVRAKRLSDFVLFEDLDPEALRDLEAATAVRVAEKGSFLFLPGDASSTVYFVVSGRVKISRLSEEGKEFILNLVDPDQFFGESGVLDDGQRETMAQALAKSILLAVPAARLRQFVARNPTVLMRLAQCLGSRQRRLEKRLVELMHKNVLRRLSGLLIQLSHSYGVRDARGTLLQIRLSQSTLGNLLGVSRESVNQAVSDLRRRGIIEVSDRRVRIHNLDTLMTAAV